MPIIDYPKEMNAPQAVKKIGGQVSRLSLTLKNHNTERTMCSPEQGYYGDNNALQSEYVGDGVYAHFDGFGIAISVNDHRNEPVCYLEPNVLKALVKFAQSKSPYFSCNE